MAEREEMGCVVGIDVGGPKKGFHAVAWSYDETTPADPGRDYATFTTPDPARLAAWCRAQDARVVAIDAPCHWSRDGRRRRAERDLARAGMACFSTPTRAAALAHPKDWYGWMLAGEKLFAAVRETHRLYDGSDATKPTSGARVCLETFPQAVACALAGRVVSAKEKATIRRELLVEIGIDISGLTSIDFVDAMLCAVAAGAFATDAFKAYGEAGDGFIVVPEPGPTLAASRPVPRPWR